MSLLLVGFLCFARLKSKQQRSFCLVMAFTAKALCATTVLLAIGSVSGQHPCSRCLAGDFCAALPGQPILSGARCFDSFESACAAAHCAEENCLTTRSLPPSIACSSSSVESHFTERRLPTCRRRRRTSWPCRRTCDTDEDCRDRRLVSCINLFKLACIFGQYYLNTLF